MYVHRVAVAGGQGEAAAGERDVDDDRAERGVQGGHGEVEGGEGPEGLHESGGAGHRHGGNECCLCCL